MPHAEKFPRRGVKNRNGCLSQSRGKERGNKRNGKKTKCIKSSDGTFIIETPQDRTSEFEPKIIPKHETILADNLEKQIIPLYAMGSSYRDISAHTRDYVEHRDILQSACQDYRQDHS